MSDTPRSFSQVPSASPLFLRDDEVRRGFELLLFGYLQISAEADEQLHANEIGRAHFRALYFIARHPGLSVGTLLRYLDVTKQSLGRVLDELLSRGLVEKREGDKDRREKRLFLTDAGTNLEAELFGQIRERLASAYAHAGQDNVTGFWRVLEGLVPEQDRELFSVLRDHR